MQRLRTLWAITAVRLSIIYTLIFAVLAVLIIVYMTGSTVGILRKQIRVDINEEFTQLVSIYDEGGMNDLMRVLGRRAAAPGANLYVVTDPQGVIVAANVRDIDNGVLTTDGWTWRPFNYARFQDNSDKERQAVARVESMPNNMRLLIGRDLGEPERFRAVVGRALALSLAAMLALGLSTWLLVGRHALKRLEMVSVSTQRIMAGDRSERLPVTGAGDEFDRLSSRMNTMLDRIALLDSGLRQVSDNIAHDLKTPLTRLRNHADSALSHTADLQKREDALRDVVDQTDRIISTFNALLMISRVESGSSAAELSTIDLSAIAHDCAELYEPAAEDAGFELTSEIEDGVHVRGNRELLSQALSNLVENALKYGAQGKEPHPVAIRLKRNSGHVAIEVADKGPGIAEKDRGRVLERFVRLEESRNQPGNGLGLSLVEAVAKLHGGKLDLLDSAPGLRAVLTLPIAEGSPA